MASVTTSDRSTMRKLLALMLLCVAPFVCRAGEAVQPAQSQFLAETLGESPSLQMLWLTPELQKQLTAILGHRYAALRLRYWQKDTRTVWVLDEIGKEEPITVGLLIREGTLQRVSVLAYRESRGGEVQQRAFTGQFSGAKLRSDRQLDKAIDGITGATLSVNALQKLARVALLLDQHVRQTDVAVQPGTSP